MHLKLLLLFLLYLWSEDLIAPSCAQTISGFVSLDCGSSATSTPYTEPLTKLVWESDSSFGLASASLTALVSPPDSTSLLVSNRQLESIRYFPGNNQTKYCYTFDESSHGITFNSTYLVRATFWAGSSPLPFTPNNGDGILRFQLLVNADVWTNVSIPIPQTEIIQKEVYVVSLNSSLSVCLSGSGLLSLDNSLGAVFDTPFISSLEIRQIPVDAQPITPLRKAIRTSPATSRAVHLVYRLNYGSSTGASIRYPDDNYDRIWRGKTDVPRISTTAFISNLAVSNDVPLAVMQTAYTTTDEDAYFEINFTSDELVGSLGGYAFALYFAEISDDVTAAGQRIFGYNVYNSTSDPPVVSRDSIDLYGDYQKYTALRTHNALQFITIHDGGFIVFDFTMDETETSTLGPLICALELYNVSDHEASSGTHDVDASAVSGAVSKSRSSSYVAT